MCPSTTQIILLLGRYLFHLSAYCVLVRGELIGEWVVRVSLLERDPEDVVVVLGFHVARHIKNVRFRHLDELPGEGFQGFKVTTVGKNVGNYMEDALRHLDYDDLIPLEEEINEAADPSHEPEDRLTRILRKRAKHGIHLQIAQNLADDLDRLILIATDLALSVQRINRQVEPGNSLHSDECTRLIKMIRLEFNFKLV